MFEALKSLMHNIAKVSHWRAMGAGVAFSIVGGAAFGQTMANEFADAYVPFVIGPAPSTDPTFVLQQGGMVFDRTDAARYLLVVGSVNSAGAHLIRATVDRDPVTQSITAFEPGIEFVAMAPFADAGLTYGPGGLLFLTRFNVNDLAQYEPGLYEQPTTIDFDQLEIPLGVTGLGFVPQGQPSAGAFKAVCWPGGEWFNLATQQLDDGRLAVVSAEQRGEVIGGPEGFVYVTPGATRFVEPSLLVVEWSSGKVAAYEIDPMGDPIISTRRDFVVGLIRPIGITQDPITGDVLICDGGLLPASGQVGARVVRVSGFPIPPRECACDWNYAGGLDSQDYFEFLEDFFAGVADFSGDRVTDSQDLFGFLDCFFSGCP